MTARADRSGTFGVAFGPLDGFCLLPCDAAHRVLWGNFAPHSNGSYKLGHQPAHARIPWRGLYTLHLYPRPSPPVFTYLPNRVTPTLVNVRWMVGCGVSLSLMGVTRLLFSTAVRAKGPARRPYLRVFPDKRKRKRICVCFGTCCLSERRAQTPTLAAHPNSAMDPAIKAILARSEEIKATQRASALEHEAVGDFVPPSQSLCTLPPRRGAGVRALL